MKLADLSSQQQILLGFEERLGQLVADVCREANFMTMVHFFGTCLGQEHGVFVWSTA